MSQRMNYHAASAAGVKALGAVVRICSSVGVPSWQVDLLFLIQHAPAKVGRDDVCAGYKQLFRRDERIIRVPAREGRLEGLPAL